MQLLLLHVQIGIDCLYFGHCIIFNSFRTKTKPYKKAQYYELRKCEGGKKATIPAIMKKTLPKILRRAKYQVQPNRTIKVKFSLGFDGAG